MPRELARFHLLVLAVSACLMFLLTPALAQAGGKTKSRASSPASAGKQVFATSCVACHGLDGRGSERGPDISTRREVQRLSDDALHRIVREGVSGRGMPSFRALGDSRIQAVVRYVRTLQGRNEMAALPGDPKAGKSLFSGKGGCAQCHMVNGDGGFAASGAPGWAGAEPLDESDL